ncbi:hypothetical protein OAA91_02035, partial [Fibrobacterales bacterium]|nr:hypothetical protein [Fibrobacterales bacterium]
MKINTAISNYFSSSWKPTIGFALMFVILAITWELAWSSFIPPSLYWLIYTPVIACGLTVLSLLGILSAVIWNFIKNRRG